MIMQQWHAATTTRHSYTLTYQFLTDLQTFVVGLELQLATTIITITVLALKCNYLDRWPNDCYVCHGCIYVAESRRGNPKIFRCNEPPFLNF